MYKTFTTGLSPVEKTYNRPAGEEMHSPFGTAYHLPAPLGSVSLDSQLPTAPCESSSLATASGGTIRVRGEPSVPSHRRCVQLMIAFLLHIP